MRTEEAAWIGDRLRALDLEHRTAARGGSFVVLNLGSGSRRFREVSKPYIDAGIFDPLRRRGATVVHSDLKREDGIDVSGDLFDPGIQARLRALQPDVVLACNILDAAVVKSSSYGAEFVRGGPLRMVRKLVRLLFPFVRPKRWLSHAHRMLWLFRPYLLA